MKYKCDFCQDTGNKEKDIGGHLTCIVCEAPDERIALEAFIEKLPAMGEQEQAWRIHQRALAMAPKQEAPAGVVAWMSKDGKETTSAASKKHMETCGYGVWHEIAPRYVVPLYAAPAVANGAEDIKDMAQARRVITQLRAAAGPDAALIEDAKRYRYLRNSASDDMPTWPINGSCWVVQYHHPQGTIPELKSAGFSSELDRAIDAAIALSGAKGN